jgi:3-deoxy-D-manno-octulosonic-acid transferase
MLIFVYRIISNLLLIPIFLFFISRFVLGKETIKSILQKFTIYNSSKFHASNKKIVWVNAVSIGEAKVGVLIAELLKEKYKSLHVILSTSTITSFKILRKYQKKFTIIYAPIDISLIIQRFIKKWRPSLALFVESEIWPSTFSILKSNSIKLKIINARLSRQSYENWKKVSFFSSELFRHVDQCIVQDRNSEIRFKDLGVKRITKVPNLKYLQKRPKINKKDFKELSLKFKNKFVVTIFSTHHDEEFFFIECFKKLEKKIHNLIFIIIPRHIERTEKIESLFKKKQIKYSIRSNKNNSVKDSSIFLVDTFGELPLFFKLSKIAIVGGSFVKKGGQNPIEASFFDCPVLCGPHMYNFSEIIDEIVKNKAGIVVQNKKELEEKIIFLKENLSERIKLSKNFSKLCESRKKKSKELINKVFESSYD